MHSIKVLLKHFIWYEYWTWLGHSVVDYFPVHAKYWPSLICWTDGHIWLEDFSIKRSQGQFNDCKVPRFCTVATKQAPNHFLVMRCFCWYDAFVFSWSCALWQNTFFWVLSDQKTWFKVSLAATLQTLDVLFREKRLFLATLPSMPYLSGLFCIVLLQTSSFPW